MPNKNEKKRITLETCATYRICVQGCLEEVWSDRLAGMQITMNIPVYNNPVTTLVGELKDQAELIGVLNGLYELRMPLLSVELLKDKKESQS